MLTPQQQEAHAAYCAAYEAQRAIREEKMTALREAVKKSGWTYAQIASRAGNHPSFIGQMLRGGFPHNGANLLTKKVRVVLEDLGFDVPDEIKTF